MVRTILAAIIAVVLITPAQARQKASGLHPECGVTMLCIAPYASTPDQARVTRGRYIARSMGFGAAIEKRPVRVYKRNRHHVPVEMISIAEPSIVYTISKPARYIAGRLICAINVSSALAERGIKGTGSALAMSYLHWGRSAGGPVPGAVIVSARRGGGHVAIVSRVVNGVVMAWNATGGQRGWREIPYRHRVIDYRVPG